MSTRIRDYWHVTLEQLLAVSQRLNAATESLAALGAYLRMVHEGTEVPGPVAAELATVARNLGIDPDEPLTDAEAEQTLGFIRAFFAQAESLLNDPGNDLAWKPTDPLLLQSQGRASRVIAWLVREASNNPDGIPGLEESLSRTGSRILDVGTGVGWLAIEFANVFPYAEVVGIDVWEPSLTIARRNIAASDLVDRVTVKNLDATRLNFKDEFDLAFLPGPFLPHASMASILAGVSSALRPGGCCVLGLYAPPDDSELTEALTAIRVLRSGGYPWTAAEAINLMELADFTGVHAVARTWSAPMRFVAATA